MAPSSGTVKVCSDCFLLPGLIPADEIVARLCGGGDGGAVGVILIAAAALNGAAVLRVGLQGDPIVFVDFKQGDQGAVAAGGKGIGRASTVDDLPILLPALKFIARVGVRRGGDGDLVVVFVDALAGHGAAGGVAGLYLDEAGLIRREHHNLRGAGADLAALRERGGAVVQVIAGQEALIQFLRRINRGAGGEVARFVIGGFRVLPHQRHRDLVMGRIDEFTIRAVIVLQGGGGGQVALGAAHLAVDHRAAGGAGAFSQLQRLRICHIQGGILLVAGVGDAHIVIAGEDDRIVRDFLTLVIQQRLGVAIPRHLLVQIGQIVELVDVVYGVEFGGLALVVEPRHVFLRGGDGQFEAHLDHMVFRDIVEGVSVFHQTIQGDVLAVHRHIPQPAARIGREGQRDAAVILHHVKGVFVFTAGDRSRALADHADHVLVSSKGGIIGDAERLEGREFPHTRGLGAFGVQGIEDILSVLHPVEGVVGMVEGQVLGEVGGDVAAGLARDGGNLMRLHSLNAVCAILYSIQINGIEGRLAAVIRLVGADGVQSAVLVKGDGVDDVVFLRFKSGDL